MKVGIFSTIIKKTTPYVNQILIDNQLLQLKRILVYIKRYLWHWQSGKKKYRKYKRFFVIKYNIISLCSVTRYITNNKKKR